MTMGKVKWSKEHERKLTQLVGNGIGARAIGEQLGFTTTAIAHKVSRMGLRLTHRVRAPLNTWNDNMQFYRWAFEHEI
jgi:hypothetical protein